MLIFNTILKHICSCFYSRMSMDAEIESKLCEAITAICKEHLPFRHMFVVEGLLSIEIDDEEFVSIMHTAHVAT